MLWTALSTGLRPVLGDRIQFQQVLLNRLLNGIEALQSVTDRMREVQSRSYQHASGDVCVAVRDSGIGLDPQTLARIFDAFFTTKPGGTGIGLSISRTIIEAHGGRLWATSHDAPGATFQVNLPVAAGGDAAPYPRPAQQVDCRRLGDQGDHHQAAPRWGPVIRFPAVLWQAGGCLTTVDTRRDHLAAMVPIDHRQNPCNRVAAVAQRFTSRPPESPH